MGLPSRSRRSSPCPVSNAVGCALIADSALRQLPDKPTAPEKRVETRLVMGRIATDVGAAGRPYVLAFGSGGLAFGGSSTDFSNILGRRGPCCASISSRAGSKAALAACNLARARS